MRFKTLGNTGRVVSEICLGTMTFGRRGFCTAIGTLDQSIADGIVARASALPPEYPSWMISRLISRLGASQLELARLESQNA